MCKPASYTCQSQAMVHWGVCFFNQVSSVLVYCVINTAILPVKCLQTQLKKKKYLIWNVVPALDAYSVHYCEQKN